MSKQRKLIALMLVLVLIVTSLAACAPAPGRKPIPAPNGTNNNNTGMNTPYVAQNTPGSNANNGAGTGAVTNYGTAYTTTSMFSKLDYSYATIIPSTTNIRSGLSTGSPVIGTLTSGDRVKVIGKLNGLYIINLPNTNTIGTILPNHAKLYSAIPGSTAPAPTKPLPTTVGTTGTGTTGTGMGTGMGTGTTSTGIGNGTTGTPYPSTIPGVTGTTGSAGTGMGTGTTGTTGLNNNTGTNGTAGTGGTTGGTTTNAPTSTASGTLTADASKILQLCNAERAKVGARPLSANADLTKLANMKSQDMAKNNYFSHQSPTYGSPFDMMKTYGISYMYAGENLAINQNADGAFNAWMNSEGHRRNILNADFTDIGIGIYPKGDGSIYYTQEFIGK